MSDVKKNAVAKRTAEPGVTPRDPFDATQLRYEFYRDGFRGAVKICLILSVMLLGSLSANVLQLMTEPPPKYLGMTTDGRVLELPTLDKPMWSDANLLNWTAQAVAEAYTFSHRSYQRDFARAAVSFTPDGWKGFENALVNETRNLEAVVQRKINVYSIVTGASIVDRNINTEGNCIGRCYWVIEMPMTITWEGLSEVRTDRVLARVKVVRRDVTEHERGIGIEEYRLIPL